MPSAYSSDVAFTPTVKAIQTAKGSRATYARMEQAGGWQTEITPDLSALLAEQTSVFLATVNGVGRPYIQHRGGPPGFLVTVDPKTVGFADFRGNRQYITLGNIAENPHAHLFLIDYARKQRVKIWGSLRAVEDDPALIERLMPSGYTARAERALLFSIEAWDSNCPQHIPQRFEAADVAAALAVRDQRIAQLEAEVAALGAGRTP